MAARSSLGCSDQVLRLIIIANRYLHATHPLYETAGLFATSSFLWDSRLAGTLLFTRRPSGFRR